MKPRPQLGHTVLDTITGFFGIVVGEVSYITGCNQCLVQPRCKDGDWKESHWIDEDRLEVDATIPQFVLYSNAGIFGIGGDKEAPRK